MEDDATHYSPCAEGVAFGDIFRPYFFDIYQRNDVVRLCRAELPMTDDRLVVYGPALVADKPGDFCLAHGQSASTVILTDSCAIATMAGRPELRQNPRPGRIILAPISPATPAQLKELQASPSFGRFPLPEEASQQHGVTRPPGIVELRRCFSAASQAVFAVADRRECALSEDLAADLAVRWAAHACRRGPNVFRNNADKMRELITAMAGDEAAATRAARSVVEVLDEAWVLEGGTLEAIAPLHEKQPGDPLRLGAAINDLIDGLQHLTGRAAEAIEALEASRIRL